MAVPAIKKAAMSEQGYLTVPLASVPTGIKLPYSLHVKIGERWIMLRPKGERLEVERGRSLMEKKVTVLGILRAEWAEYVRHLESSLDLIGIKEGDEDSALRVRSLLNAYFRELEVRRELTEDFLGKIQNTAEQMPVAIGQSREIARNILKREKDPSLYFSNHAVNMAVYSVAIGLKCGMGMKSLQEVAFAASVANVGNITLDPAMLYKPSALNAEEWVEIHKHPQAGADILRLLLVPDTIHSAVQFHSERYDGSGYPSGLSGEKIPIYSRILAVAELFSAVTSERPWASAIEPHRAIDVLQRLKGKFDPQIVRFV